MEEKIHEKILSDKINSLDYKGKKFIINQKICDLKEIIANRQNKPETIKLCEQKIAELEKTVPVN